MRDGMRKLAATGARRQPLIVTTSWDDGHPSDLRLAGLLAKHGLQGTFYVPCTNSEGRPVMGAAQTAELSRQFEIGGHTQSHVDLTALAPQLAAEQIRSNKARLEDLLGREVGGFAYVRGRHNRVVRDLVDKAGFRYARTVKNLMSSPGRDRLQVPTTTKFFAHSTSTYIRNYLSGGPNLQRGRMLPAVLAQGDLALRVSRAAEACAAFGGFFHLWGHSWELDEHGLWAELDRALARLRAFDARFVTNADWCARLAGTADAAAPPVSELRSEKRA
jgi:peptidoglycan/xylan/chitin deacetylase (PgdA/CDA1 family)